MLVTSDEIERLIKAVADEADEKHMRGDPDCLVCHAGEAVARSKPIAGNAYVASVLQVAGDPSEICILLASVFAAGARYQSEQEMLGRVLQKAGTA